MTQSKTLIFIHGFRGTHHGLELIAKEFKGFRIIIPDLPGFAEGDHLEAYNLASYVEWLHAFIKEQKLEVPPILLGHSFGTIISAAYAAKYPSTIEKLILVNPIGAPALEGPRAFATRLTEFYYWVGKQLPEKLGTKWLASRTIVLVMGKLMIKTKDKKLREFINDQHLRYFSLFHDRKSVAESFTTSVSHNVTESAPAIQLPTLIIAGAKDDITPLSKQRELQKLFSDAQLEVIEDVGHLTHYESPKDIAQFVQDFIRLP